jgi:hypothetical protein
VDVAGMYEVLVTTGVSVLVTVLVTLPLGYNVVYTSSVEQYDARGVEV